MVYGDVCSGISAPTAAWKPLGWRPAFYAEIDPAASAVLKHHYPTVPNAGDFTAIQEGQYEPIDVLVGGTPCQDFSVAGLRAGMDGARGQLTVEFARLAGRLRSRWLVWENVPGVLSSDGGRAFGAFLGILGQLGYGVAYRVLDAQHFGVPQRRRRVFVVGHLGDWRRAAAVLFERHSLSGHPPPRRKAGQVAPTIPARSLGGGGLGTDFDCDGGLVETPLSVVSTLDASFGRLQGCSGQDANHGHSHLVAFGGNNCAGPIEVATAVNTCSSASGRMDFESETFVTHSLRAEGFDASEDGTGRGVPLVPMAFDTTQITSKANYSTPRPGAPCHPLASGAHPPTIAFTCKDHGADAGDISPTLRSMGHDGSHANAGGQVAVAFQASQSGTRMVEAHATLDSNNGSRRHNGILAGMAVRRLTPVECARLQGFPDDYLTSVRRNGKPLADGPMYKMLGNSMAVPVLRWIGQRIEMVDHQPQSNT